MKPIAPERVSYEGPAVLAIGEKRIPGVVTMTGVLHFVAGKKRFFGDQKPQRTLESSEVSGTFTPGTPEPISKSKSVEAAISWVHRGERITVPVRITEVAADGIKFSTDHH
jgi:hypothetical protein